MHQWGIPLSCGNPTAATVVVVAPKPTVVTQLVGSANTDSIDYLTVIFSIPWNKSCATWVEGTALRLRDRMRYSCPWLQLRCGRSLPLLAARCGSHGQGLVSLAAGDVPDPVHENGGSSVYAGSSGGPAINLRGLDAPGRGGTSGN